MIPLDKLRAWFDKRREEIYEDLFTFLKFPTVSTDKKYRKSMQECAEWLVAYFQKGGFSSELLKTETVPIVFAEKAAEKKQAKTVLVYGHYDVQPVDPLNEWHSDPFQPEEREGKIFARGSSDDKGQIFYALLAALAYYELAQKLPVNLKFCIEGEEESHSLGLSHALATYKEKLSADALLIVDFDQLETGPVVGLGARGSATMEMTLQGSDTDLHSGMLGGVAYNPIRALTEMLSQVWDETGRVRAPHFYDDVQEEDTSQIFYPYDRAHFEKMFGLRSFGGIAGKSLKESNWFLPTVEINGIYGGYAGEGFKTVIPAKAGAKISTRLVPSQDPDRVLSYLKEFFESIVPEHMELKCECHGGDPAWRSSVDSFLSKALFRAAEEVTEKKCSYTVTGGSIPIGYHFIKELEVEVTGMGFGLGSDCIHAPNEHFEKKRFELGFFTFARMLACMGEEDAALG